MKDRSRSRRAILRLCQDWTAARVIATARNINIVTTRDSLNALIALGHAERKPLDGIPIRGTPNLHLYRCTPAGLEWLHSDKNPNGAPSKTCSRCCKDIPLRDYYNRPDRQGVMSACKECYNSAKQRKPVVAPVAAGPVNQYNPFEWRTYVQPFQSII